MQVEFAGETFEVEGEGPFVIGRDGNLAIDDNPYLHRQFLHIRRDHDLWWILNVGTRLSATVEDPETGVHAWLTPGGRMPIVFLTTHVRFVAGPTSYEITIINEDAPYSFDRDETDDDGTTTLGRVRLTEDQRLMLVVLAEAALRRGLPGVAEIPSSTQAAKRLGWTQKKFEKKIDNVCERLAMMGVRGLKGEAGNLASSRRTRLVEYALAARIITFDDLALIDSLGQNPAGRQSADEDRAKGD